mmetsp:Transcript_47256/g.106525  ORF Transcript_47256/g.106525 Transcript_47256/m.106525 type:complete len:148 (+) Transcript_47256:710-1153(+)
MGGSRNRIQVSIAQALRREAETAHSRLLATTERMQKGTEKLRAARAAALETETIGANIMADLETQRQTLERSRATLAFANTGLDRSKKIIVGMGRRAAANRVLMCFIIIALVGMIGAIIWLRFFFSPSSSHASLATGPPPSPPVLRN